MDPAAIHGEAAVASHTSAGGALLIRFRTYKSATQEETNSELQLAQ
jgi:hypothetical protein